MSEARYIDDDLERMLLNWQAWIFGTQKNPLGFGLSALARMGVRSGRRNPGIPVMLGDALDIDAAIERLPPRYRRAVKLAYLWPDRTDELRALACGISRPTFVDWLNEGKRQIRATIDAGRRGSVPFKSPRADLKATPT
jgi:hypothetical protein